MFVPFYLMASYLYYHEDYSLYCDEYYDQLCSNMLFKWDEIDHRHKKLIDRDSLRAGTGFSLPKNKYPSITKSAAIGLMQKYESRG